MELKTDKVEQLGEFDAPVIAITLYDGMAEGITILHDGKLVSAELSPDVVSGTYIKSQRGTHARGASSVPAPAGMRCHGMITSHTRTNAVDLRMVVETDIQYLVDRFL